MRTEEFLRLVVPQDGLKVLAEYIKKDDHPRGGFFRHTVFEDTAVMARVAEKMDSAGKTVYHACSTFREVLTTKNKKTGKTKQQVRVQVNAKAARSLWVDLDVGKAGAAAQFSYDTQAEAVGAIRAFCKATGMPAPLLVSSGYGIHAYWTFANDATPLEWQSLAALLRAAFRHLGIKFDPSRDQDIASILRPVGCHNWKNPDAPKKVRALNEVIPQPIESYFETLHRYVDANDAPLMPPKFIQVPGVNDELRSVQEHPPSSGHVVAQHCAQIRMFRDLQGAVEYTLWRDCLGLIKHTTESDELAHLWSQGHDTYDYDECQEKLDDWNTGPTTCDEFKRVNPTGCDGCPHKVKSPIQLGVTEAAILASAPSAPVPTPPEETLSDAPAQASAAAEFVEPPAEADAAYLEERIKNRYRWDGQKMTVPKTDKKGIVALERFATSLFIPTSHMRLEDGTLALRIKAMGRKDVWREFDLPTKLIPDGRALKVALAARGVVVYDAEAAMNYLDDYQRMLRAKLTEVSTYRQCGFAPDGKGFLIGDTLITPDEERRVLLNNEFKAVNDAAGNIYSGSGGSVAEWTAGVDTLYNAEHGEPYQFTICAAFGGVLTPLLGSQEWFGIPLALTSDNSSRGKTTVAKIGMNIYSQAGKLTIPHATMNAMLATASTMGNLPCLFDEVTDFNQNDLKMLLHALSMGGPKARLGSNGEVQRRGPGWKLISFLTSNNNLLHRLTETKGNPEAAQMRCFEIDLASYPMMAAFEKGTPENQTHPALATEMLNKQYGAVGLVYLRHVMANRELISMQLKKVSDALIRKVADSGNLKERYYAYLISCAVVGGIHAKKLGLIHFNIEGVQTWAYNHIKRLRAQAIETNFTHTDHFARMLTESREHILITRAFSTLDGRRNVWELVPDHLLPSSIRGRWATDEHVLYLLAHTFDDWCRRNGVHAVDMKRRLRNDGILKNFGPLETKGNKNGVVKVALGRGVARVPTVAASCLEFDMRVAGGLLDDLLPAEVVPIESGRKPKHLKTEPKEQTA